ncbi:17591_t:CDS:1, partial [Gigaspora margarita]
LDKSSQSELQYNKKFLLHKWMQRQNFFDPYKLPNPSRKEFTWSNRRSSTRIDQIWFSENLLDFFEDAYILYMDVCTGSDHNLAAASFNMHRLISKIILAPNYKKQDRQVFEYEKTNKENWEQYQEDLYNFLSKRS